MARRRRTKRSRPLLRWAALAGLVLFGLLYYKPARTYLRTRHEVATRTEEVRQLRAQHRRLQHLVAASTSGEELAREARRLGFVRPDERLFIVKGIDAWLKEHARVGRGGG